MYRKPRRIKKKKPLLRDRRFWFFVSCAGIFLVFFYLVAFAQVFQIKHVVVEGQDSALENGLQSIARGAIGKNVAFLQSRSIFLVDTRKIQTEALSQFPEIDSLKVARVLPNTLLLVPQKRQEDALWCGEQASCFALDKNGILFAEKKSEGEFAIFDLLDNAQPVLGRAALGQALLSQLLDFRARAEKLATFVSVTLVSETHAQYKTSEGWLVHMDPKGNIDWQLTKLQTVLEQKIPFPQRKGLLYIDLRFGDQAYIKSTSSF